MCKQASISGKRTNHSLRAKQECLKKSPKTAVGTGLLMAFASMKESQRNSRQLHAKFCQVALDQRLLLLLLQYRTTCSCRTEQYATSNVLPSVSPAAAFLLFFWCSHAGTIVIQGPQLTSISPFSSVNCLTGS